MRKFCSVVVVVGIVFFASLSNAQDGPGGGRRGRRGGNRGEEQNGGAPSWGGGGPGAWGGGPGYPGGGPAWGGGGPGYPAGGPAWGGGAPSWGGGGQGYPGGGGSREERFAGFLQQYDTNHDGQIDASEVQTAGPRAAFLDGMLRRAGVEAKYPVKISAIQEAMHNVRNNGGGPFGPPGGSFGGPPGGGTPPGSETAPSSSDAKPAAAPAPLVPGFGVEQPKMAPVPGFDVVSKPGATVAASSVSAGGSESDSTPAMSPDQLDKTIRDHAAARMKQHDKNRSGALEKDQGEWDDLKDKDAKAMDRDRNGVITLEELTAFDMAENGVRPAKKSEPSHKAVATGAAATSSDSPIRTGKTYRILSPIERLPEGLPDWFARNDANGDGQISMAEFTRDWTPTKAAEYSRYDLNGDGMVTTDECLKIENAAEKK